MKPYFEENGISIYHGDCRDILPHLNLSDSVLLTDPVYGVNGGRGGDARDYGKANYRKSTWTDDEQYVREVCVPAVEYLLSRVIRGAVTPGNRCAFLYPRPADIGCFWTPAASTHSPWGMVYSHPILYYGKDYRAGKGALATGRMVTESAPKNGHPCPKPVTAWQWLANKVAQQDDVLVDPFVGSGTTLRVAKNLGIRAVGIEIEERYCEIAVRSLSQEVLFGGAAA